MVGSAGAIPAAWRQAGRDGGAGSLEQVVRRVHGTRRRLNGSKAGNTRRPGSLDNSRTAMGTGSGARRPAWPPQGLCRRADHLSALSSAGCALAPDAAVLIASRAVQGAGAATIMPMALALLNAAFPPARRGWAIGIYGGVTALAAVAGPVLGGAVDLPGLALVTAAALAWCGGWYGETRRAGTARSDRHPDGRGRGGGCLRGLGTASAAPHASGCCGGGLLRSLSVPGRAGFALAIPAVTRSVTSTVPAADIGTASGAFTTMRQLGGAFGVAIVSAAFAATGSYASPGAFSRGFTTACGVAAGLALAGAATGTILPPRRH